MWFGNSQSVDPRWRDSVLNCCPRPFEIIILCQGFKNETTERENNTLVV